MATSAKTALEEDRPFSLTRPLRVLIVDDVREDAERMLASLKRAGYSLSFDVVFSPETYKDRLQREDYDVILSDHNLRTWTGRDALEILNRLATDVPFIVVTGSLGDEAAVDYIKHGAADYVLKHHMELLPGAVKTALHERGQQQKRHRANRCIVTAKREWDLTFDSVPDAVMILDNECLIHRANRAATEILGLPFSQVIGRRCYEVLHGTCEAPTDCPHQRLLITGAAQRTDYCESRLGKTFDVTTTPLRDHSGSLHGCIHVLRDISERKDAEVALLKSEEKHRDFIENATYGFLRVTPDGRFLDINSAFVAMLGFESKEEVLELNFSDLYEDRSGRGSPRQLFASNGGSAATIEVSWRRRDNQTIPVRLRGRAIHDEVHQTRHFDVIAEDVTERRVLEQQLHEAQKIEAIGRLAGGFAHDFNNLLCVVVGYCDLLLDCSEVDTSVLHKVQEIKKAGQRAADLTKQLLAFSRNQVLMPQLLDLNSVVHECSKMVLPLIGESVQLVTKLASDLHLTKADPLQIEHVILNLALNARDAMPNGGKLVIKTHNQRINQHDQQRQKEIPSGDYVVLAVGDTGVGVDKDTQSHLFEPFFTTKGRKKGTGLGLAAVYGIVRQSGGHVWVCSEPAKGTTFKIYFPCVDGMLEREGHTDLPLVPAGAGTILLVEDEPPLRELAHQLLDKMGYTVLEACDGAVALQVAQEYKQTIQLLLTDLIMPGMSGWQLAETLTKTDSQLKVLYMSGHADDVIMHHGVLKEGVAFLQKPFTRDTLARKISEILAPII